MTSKSESERGPALRDGLLDGNVGKILVGFGIAVLLVYLLVMAVGWDGVMGTLEGADYTWLGIAALSTTIGLAAWGKSWQVVLSVLGIDVDYRRLVVTYFAATFANYITPLGQAGGEPFIAYVLSKDTGASYEDSLASVITADLLNLLPFFNFAAVGLSYLLLRTELPRAAEQLAVGLVGLAVGVPLLAGVGWQYRDAIERGILRLISPIATRTKRMSLDSVQGRIERFYRSLERITGSPRALLYAVAFSYTGWVFFALPLYFAGRTLGLPIDLILVLFIVPASTLAGLIPLPGGLGGVEIALVVLLVALIPTLTNEGATAIALVYRLASFWFALGIGGIAAMYVVARS